MSVPTASVVAFLDEVLVLEGPFAAAQDVAAVFVSVDALRDTCE